MKAWKKKRFIEAGFTLLEIIIAVAVLSVSLVTLLGLESAIMRQTLQDRERQNALLVARRVLSAMETSEEPISPGTKSGTVRTLMQEFLSTDDDRSFGKDPNLDLECRLQVDYLKLPGIENERAIKKNLLTIYWGPSNLDSLDVVYLTPEAEADDEKEPE